MLTSTILLILCELTVCALLIEVGRLVGLGSELETKGTNLYNQQWERKLSLSDEESPSQYELNSNARQKKELREGKTISNQFSRKPPANLLLWSWVPCYHNNQSVYII